MGVNSFGFGGANAHILLEEYILGDTAELHALHKPETPPLFLSANSEDALQATAQQYADLLTNEELDIKYYDLAYSASNYRQQLKYGLAINGSDRDDIVEKLLGYATDNAKNAETKKGIATTRKQSSKHPKLALVFSGNGSQWQGMGCELLETEPLFKSAVEEIDELLTAHSEDPISLVDEFNASVEDSRLEYTEVAQLLLFALQVGIIRVLNAHGLKAEATLGHSVGEVSAAWAAGALTLEQAVEVIYERSHAQGETKGSGRMAAVGMGYEAIQDVLQTLDLQDAITIAGINSPNAVTLSGALNDLEQLSEILKEQSVFYRILDLDYAFHSPEMLPIEERVKTTLHGLKPQQGDLRFVSTVTGSDLDGNRLDATYWWENIRQPVLFNKAMDTLIDDGFEVFLEIGPHPILRSYISECCRSKEVAGLSLPTQTRKTASLPSLLDGLYSSYLAGCALDRCKLFPKKGAFIPLPNYPWQREKHWYTLTPEGADLVNRKREHPLLGYRLRNAIAQWENQLDTHKFPYLKDHVVDGGVVFPAAGYIEMALAASALWFNSSDGDHEGKQASVEIENLEIKAPIVLDNAKSTRFTLLTDDGSFTIESRDRMSENPWTLNVVGRLLGATNRQAPKKIKPKAIAKAANLHISKAGHYQLTESVGLSYGTGFQGVDQVWVAPQTALAQLKIPAELVEDYDQYHLHPSMLDAGFQVLVDVFSEDIRSGKQAALIPVQIGKLYQYDQAGDITYLQVNIRKQSPQSVVADFLLLNKKGAVLAELLACRFKGVQFA
ncbi:MAG: acyltransferase domain-containing protein, partial [Thiotrichaceae bacterium]